jgi:uncharacterized protein (TIGR02246 family)
VALDAANGGRTMEGRSQSPDQAEKAAILNHLGSFGNSLLAKDIDAVASHFASESVFVGGAGATIGQSNIAKRYQFMYSGRFKGATNNLKLTHISMPTSDVALVVAACVAANVAKTSGEIVPDIKSNVVTTLVKLDGAWQILSQAVVNEGSDLAVQEIKDLTSAE